MEENKIKSVRELKLAKKKFYIAIILIDLITVILTYFIMPIVQSFPPLSEDFGFQEKVQTLTHIQQYVIIFILGIIIHLASFNAIMKNIKNYIKRYENNSNILDEEILKIRTECQNIPYKVFIVQMLLFISIGIVFNLIMLVQFFTIVKFTLMIIAITSIVSLLTFIATQKYLNKVLLSTYDITMMYKNNMGYRINNTKSLVLQTIPFIAVVLVILSLIGYAKAIEQKGEASANYYKVYLNKTELEKDKISIEYLKEKLNEIPLNDKEDSYFIITPNDKEIYNSNENKAISQFVLEYRDYFYNEFQEGMLYENFGTDERIYAMSIFDENNEKWYIGFKFSIVDEALLVYYFGIIILLTLAYAIVLYIWAKNINENIVRILNNLKQINQSEHIDKGNIVPIMANNEIR